MHGAIRNPLFYQVSEFCSRIWIQLQVTVTVPAVRQ